MRVLITNNTLAVRAGSELYARDIALALLRRGHLPVVYSTELGAVAQELRDATVPVIDDLAQLAVAPDVIHGQHHLDAMTAMLRFPQVPAVYFCHGWMPWEEMPPKFPSIRAYVAVDDLCAERLRCEHGVAPSDIRVIRNFVDLERVAMRADLPVKPRRALVFSNQAREDGYLGIVRKACAVRGIEVDVIGALGGRIEANPLPLLRQYDVVFAKARSAIEAMASGVAVVVCDAAGLAGLVAEDHYAAWRDLNFGVRTLRRPIDVETILQELDNYDAAQALRLALRVRREADMEGAVDAIVETYVEAVDRQRTLPVDARAQFDAASEYLRSIAAVTKVRHAALKARELAEAEMRHQHLRAERAEEAHHAASAELEHSKEENQRLHEQLGQAEHRIEHLSAEQEGLRRHADALLDSLSWRITAPLRGAVDLLKKIFARHR